MKNFSLRTKLFMLSGFLLAVSLVVGGIGTWAVRAIDRDYSEITNISMPNTEHVNRMQLSLRQIRIELFQLSMPGTPTEDDERSLKEIDRQTKIVEETLERYKTVPFSEGEAELFTAYETSLRLRTAISPELSSFIAKAKTRRLRSGSR
ncbi:MAG TPA: MCP four helix bundle domain-containing protein [Pseudobdellovibrionaceae bacterium]|nr:MCP four helix bundle domain-containing protein [Pseudobdellovibrionaceae bacterium]